MKMINFLRSHYLISTIFIITAILISVWGCTIFKNTQVVPVVEHQFPADENSITFIGHAATLVHLNNKNILTDPNFNNWCVINKRSREAGMRLDDLPRIDIILISHAHYDHPDKWTLKQLPQNIPVLISTGNGDRVRKWGFKNVQEVDS